MTAAARANTLHILIAASVMMSLAMGMRQCLGLFLPPMTQALAMSASDFTFAIAVQNIVWGLAQAPLGAMADRWGLRPVMVLGALAYVAAMAVMTAATGTSTFLLAQSLIGIGIACTGSSLAMTAAARAASPERRSVILGIVGAFSSVGTLVIAPVLQGLLGVWDWRWGAVLFVILAAAIVPAAMVTGRVDRLPQPSLQRASAAAAIGEALRNRRFVVLCATHFVCGLQLIFINTHLPNYLAICGLDPMLGATALAIIGGINIAGCLLAGWLGQHYLKNVLLGLTYLARSGVLMVYFLFPPTPVTTVLFAAAMLGLLWFEDPFWPPEDLLDCPALPGIVIGMGADFGSAEQMAVFSKTPAIGVLQPDVCMLGGLSEAKRTLAMLAAANKTAAPHTPFVGPAALASLHLLAVTEEEGYFATVEADDSMDLYGIGLTRWQKSLDVPTGPGLGFDPDPGFLRRHLYAAG